MFLCGAYFANAQCAVGYAPTGIFDDYSSTTESGGLYFWAGTGTPGFTLTASRTNTPGKLAIIGNNPYGSYTPVGLSFGKTTSGAQKTINLTTDKTFSVDLTNPSSDTSSITFVLAISDSTSTTPAPRMIDTYAAAGTDLGGFANAYKYHIATTLAPGQTKTFSGTYAGGYFANYTTSTLDQNINFTIVSQVSMTIINAKQNAADSYKPYEIGNGANPVILIDNLKIGACGTITSIAAPAVSNANMTIVPNPASSEVVVSYNGTSGNVTFNVSDVTGKVVKTIAGNGTQATINVSDLNKGMYFVTTISNNAPVSVSKLVVE